MWDVMESQNKLKVAVPDKYLKSDIFNPVDELFIGAIKYLRDEGKTCEFFGFNILNGHVVLIDGIKYYTKGNRIHYMQALSYETFFIVNDVNYDFIENRLRERVDQILEVLGDKK